MDQQKALSSFGLQLNTVTYHSDEKLSIVSNLIKLSAHFRTCQKAHQMKIQALQLMYALKAFNTQNQMVESSSSPTAP